MDITTFHERMQHKYADQSRHHRLLRTWILYVAAPAVLLLSFVLAYLSYAGK